MIECNWVCYNILYTHWYVDIILKDLYIKIKKKKKNTETVGSMYPQLSQFAKFPIISTPFEYLNHFFAYQFSRKLIFSIFLHLDPWFLLSSVQSTFFSAILHKSNTNIASRSFKNLSYLYIIKNPPIVPNIDDIWMGMTLKCGILFGGQRFQSNVFRNSVAMGGTY